jgi:hypothetical protein
MANVSEMVKTVRNVPGLAGVLEGMRTSAIGARVTGDGVNAETLAGLRLAGVIGANDGLTIKGSAVAMRLQSEYLERMLPL